MKPRSKSGLTLVELIIAVAFTAVIIAAACMVFYFGSHSFQNGTVNAANQQNATLVESYLQQYASTAFTLSSTDDRSTQGAIFRFSDGTLNIQSRTTDGGTASQVASIDGFSKIELKIQDKVLNYTIISADQTYRLKGGIVLNNYQSGDVNNLIPGGSSVLFLAAVPPSDGT